MFFFLHETKYATELLSAFAVQPSDGPTFCLAVMATILPAVAGVCTMWQAQAQLGARGLVSMLFHLSVSCLCNPFREC